MSASEDLPPLFEDAVKGFWDRRTAQRQAQELLGKVDRGSRSDVTGGKQMDGFLLKITDLLTTKGVPVEGIHIKKSLTVLPGFFRPTKTYDLLVVYGGRLRAVLELKSQVGPSFGNNFNNRVEEAMGCATDIWTAYREGAFGKYPAPWLGYLMLLEDCAESRSSVTTTGPHFPVLAEFRASSYATRYELFYRKMLRERLCNGACFLLANRAMANAMPNYSEPAADLTASLFIEGLLRSAAPTSE